MRHLDRTFVAVTAAIASLVTATGVHASFHLWQIDQIYSDASGNVQYVEFFTTFSGQESLTLLPSLQTSQGGNTQTYTFTTILPATLQHTTQNQKFLVATQGFAALNIVTPDYVVPNGFLFTPGGTIAFGIYDSVTYSGLGSNGTKALDRNGSLVATTPTNFTGTTGCVSIPPPSPAGLFDIDGDGVVDPLTDGVLLIRYLFGLRGAALIDHAVGPCAGRSTADLIQTYIANQLPPP